MIGLFGILRKQLKKRGGYYEVGSNGKIGGKKCGKLGSYVIQKSRNFQRQKFIIKLEESKFSGKKRGEYLEKKEIHFELKIDFF